MTYFYNLPITRAGVISLALGGVTCYSIGASAAPVCYFNGSGTITATVPLRGANITVGPDTPNGTVLFRQYFRPSRSPQVNCSAVATAYSWRSDYLYTALPKPLSGWNSGTLAGRVYETGVPGIGVYIWWSNRPFPVLKTSGTWTTANAIGNFILTPDFDLSLIKTGPVSPGTISGSNLPTAALNFSVTGGNALRIMTVGFNGSLNVVSQTCTTPENIPVPLGKYDISADFSGKGSASAWQDATIRLTNCPRFYGTINNEQNNFSSDNGTYGIGTATQNRIGLKLSPNTTVINAAQGIFAVQSGTGNATGVGIQLAYGISASPTLADLNAAKNYVMSSTTGTAWNLPLVARYIQTGDTITPGKANATVTYTITYN
jgi:major type 1 subunit fimbrin (pilin)